MKSIWTIALGILLGEAMAAETLFSNYVLNVNESGTVGKLWTFSRGDIYSGATLLTLSVGSGNVQVKESMQVQVSDSMTAVQDGIFTDMLAEHRRTPAVFAGSMGYLLPMFGLNDDGNYLIPTGMLSIRGEDNFVEMPFTYPDAFEDFETPMDYAASALVYDSSSVWIANGAAGLYQHELENSRSKKLFALNVNTKTLDTMKSSFKYDSTKYASVFGIARHPKTKDLWFATSHGVWIKDKNGSLTQPYAALGNKMRVTGIWIGGEPIKVIAETSQMSDESSITGALWQLGEKSKDFAKVNFLDTLGKKQKKDVYDDGDYTVTGVAFIGSNTFVGVSTAAGNVSGYFKIEDDGVRAFDLDGNMQWLYGFETGATDRDTRITGICSFNLAKGLKGLAISTYGNGISVSADSGKTWSTILNRARLGENLGSIRMVPSVITAGDQALVSYKVSKQSKITIDVFSYDMRKVRTIVRDAPREADASRSTDPKNDYWDGKDKYGKACTMGVYYVRVKDNHGHIGWGKVMTLGGHK
ncbi:MAG: hypothetical protein HUK20_09330 [Fibrobacter sp.]|nr:hypothetical protein [Fibrobacter sp.]